MGLPYILDTAIPPTFTCLPSLPLHTHTLCHDFHTIPCTPCHLPHLPYTCLLDLTGHSAWDGRQHMPAHHHAAPTFSWGFILFCFSCHLLPALRLWALLIRQHGGTFPLRAVLLWRQTCYHRPHACSAFAPSPATCLLPLLLSPAATRRHGHGRRTQDFKHYARQAGDVCWRLRRFRAGTYTVISLIRRRGTHPTHRHTAL